MTNEMKQELLNLLKQFTREHILKIAKEQIKILESALEKWRAFETFLSDERNQIKDLK